MNFKPLLFLAFLMTGLISANAQQRKCEMKVTLLSPAEGTIIQAFAQYNLTVRITNNGPNDLLLGDTLWYNTPSMPLITYHTFVLQQPINVGGSADITIETNVNVNTNTQDETVTYYATVIPNPDTTAGSVRDTFLSNNVDANTVTIKPCETGGTSIHTVDARDLNISMYPNPAIDIIQVKALAANVKNIVVADISGRTIFSNTINAQQKNAFELNVAGLNAGMYFLKMETDKGMATLKFIKQ